MPSLGPGGEFDRIRGFLRGSPPLPPGVRVGPGDDGAVIEPDLVVSTDLAVEGVHFRLDWITPEEAGGRAVAAALSDLAGMAAEVVGVLVSLAAPRESAATEALVAGVRAGVEAEGGVLLGGDLSHSSGPLVVDVVAVGRSGSPLLRSRARPGDELWVTGTLGAAAAAVAIWEDGGSPSEGLRDAFARPVPRLGPARWLAGEAGARAGLDLSDGIAGDAGHLAAASAVRVRLDADALPVDPRIPGGPGGGGLELALRGGEDFELLVALPPGALDGGRVEEFVARFDLSLTRVGEVAEGKGVVLRPPGGGAPVRLERGGFDHFQEGNEA